MPNPFTLGTSVVFSPDYLTALHQAERDQMAAWSGVVTEAVGEDRAIVQWTHPVPTDMPVHDGTAMDHKDYQPATETSGWLVSHLRNA